MDLLTRHLHRDSIMVTGLGAPALGPLQMSALAVLPVYGMFVQYVMRGLGRRNVGSMALVSFLALGALGALTGHAEGALGVAACLCVTATYGAWRLRHQWEATAPEHHFSVGAVRSVLWVSLAVSGLVVVS